MKTLKGLCSLQSLSLPQNRLGKMSAPAWPWPGTLLCQYSYYSKLQRCFCPTAKSVKDLAELFSGNCPSRILKLDLRYGRVEALLQFALKTSPNLQLYIGKCLFFGFPINANVIWCIFVPSSNYILPADLLEFSTLLNSHKRSHHPTARLTLDLRLNPLDRDQDVKEKALRTLIPFCHILTDNWDSRTTMADHVSVM